MLNVLLKKAVEWDVIEKMPCSIQLLPFLKRSMPFHSFEDYERLLVVTKAMDREVFVCVLLAGDAGLRVGETMALEWIDVDLVKRVVCVQKSDWEGQVTAPKGGRNPTYRSRTG